MDAGLPTHLSLSSAAPPPPRPHRSLSLPQLPPPSLAPSLQEAPLPPPPLPCSTEGEAGREEENTTSGTPRKAIWVILFKRLEVIAAIYTGKEGKKKLCVHFHTYQPQGDGIE